MKLAKAVQPLIFCLAFLLFTAAGPANAAAEEITPLGWELHELQADQNGFLHKTGGDPYIVFPEISEQICSPSGITFSIRLDPVPDKPFYMELFWRPSYEGFGEDRKVFFIMPTARKGDTVTFTVPLEDQAGYRQIRLDFPSGLNSAFRIEKYEIDPLDNLPPGTQLLESYFRLSASATRNPAIIIPYLLKTLRHGMVRLAHDPAFLILWILLMGGLLVLHRALIRGVQKNNH